MSAAGKPYAVWFKLSDKTDVKVSVRLTNQSDSATSDFRLTDIADPKNPIGSTTAQSDRANFAVPANNLATGKCDLVIDFLPVAPATDTSAITFWVAAEQNGAKLAAFDVDSNALPQSNDGAAVCSPPVGASGHCAVYLFTS